LKIPLSGGGEIEHAAVFKISQQQYFTAAELSQQCADSVCWDKRRISTIILVI
jgi:hypothetical protein